jgi:ribosomal protein L32
MAVPKRKTSRSKVAKRRNHQKILLAGLSKDKRSGELKIAHRYNSIEDYEASKKV